MSIIKQWINVDENGWHRTLEIGYVGTAIVDYDEDRHRMVWNVRNGYGEVLIGVEHDLTTWGQVTDYMNIEEAMRRVLQWCINELSRLTFEYGNMLDELQDSMPVDIEEILQYD